MIDAAWELLKKVERDFGLEDGPEYYQYVSFRVRSKADRLKLVVLDGDFTPRQLRMIADAMDAAEPGRKS